MHCLNEKCKRELQKAYGRGLCNSCYQQALRLVKRKETTWAKLEEMNLVLPIKKVRRIEFIQWFQSQSKKEDPK